MRSERMKCCENRASHYAERSRSGARRNRRALGLSCLPTAFLVLTLCSSCSSSSDVQKVVRSFFDEVNRSNFESAKTNYVSAALRNSLDAPPVLKSHHSIQESFGGLVGWINSVEIADEQLRGEVASERVTLTLPWGTKFSGKLELIKEGGRNWRVSDWTDFKMLGIDHVNTASGFCRARNLDKAIGEYQIALAENPKDAVILTYMGNCYSFLGKSQEAEQTLLQATKMYPDAIWDAYLYLGQVYATEGKLPEAEAALKKAIANGAGKSREEGTLYNNLAWFYADHGIKTNEAVRLAQKAFSFSPDDAAVIDTLGWAYYKDGDRAQALKYLAQAAAKAPSNQQIQAHYRMVSTSPARQDGQR